MAARAVWTSGAGVWNGGDGMSAGRLWNTGGKRQNGKRKGTGFCSETRERDGIGERGGGTQRVSKHEPEGTSQKRNEPDPMAPEAVAAPWQTGLSSLHFGRGQLSKYAAVLAFGFWLRGAQYENTGAQRSAWWLLLPITSWCPSAKCFSRWGGHAEHVFCRTAATLRLRCGTSEGNWRGGRHGETEEWGGGEAWEAGKLGKLGSWEAGKLRGGRAHHTWCSAEMPARCCRW